MRAWWLVLAVSACATAPAPRETVLPRVAVDELEDALGCGLASVVARPDHDYAVSACYQVAIYHCAPADPSCTLRSIDPIAMPARVPAAPPAPDGDPGLAELAEADRLFEDGRKLAKDQRVDDACQRFARSDAIKRTFGTAVNLGDCADHDGHPAVALALYDEASRLAQRANNPGQARFARERGAALSPKLCTIVLTFDDPDAAGLTIQIGDRLLEPAAEVRAIVAPTRVDVVVSLPGVYVRRWRVTGSAGGIVELRVPPLAPRR